MSNLPCGWIRSNTSQISHVGQTLIFSLQGSLDYKYLNDRYHRGKAAVAELMSKKHRIIRHQSLCLGHTTIVAMQQEMGPDGFLVMLKGQHFSCPPPKKLSYPTSWVKHVFTFRRMGCSTMGQVDHSDLWCNSVAKPCHSWIVPFFSHGESLL